MYGYSQKRISIQYLSRANRRLPIYCCTPRKRVRAPIMIAADINLVISLYCSYATCEWPEFYVNKDTVCSVLFDCFLCEFHENSLLASLI